MIPLGEFLDARWGDTYPGILRIVFGMALVLMMLLSISGTVPLAAGRINYRGSDLATTSGHARASLGIAHVPEGRKVFPTLSVLENLQLGACRPAAKARCQESLQAVFDCFPVLYERRR